MRSIEVFGSGRTLTVVIARYKTTDESPVDVSEPVFSVVSSVSSFAGIVNPDVVSIEVLVGSLSPEKTLTSFVARKITTIKRRRGINTLSAYATKRSVPVFLFFLLTEEGRLEPEGRLRCEEWEKI